MIPVLPKDCDVFLFTGNYGSGKTEVSVNVANTLGSAHEQQITIADLDLVNPYFRCREARGQMEDLGIRVVAPDSDMHNADLPIVMPEVRGAIAKPQGPTILDVGGDNVGATVLASLEPSITCKPYEMYFVLNKNRPFTDTVEGALQLMNEIETSAKVKITSIIGNTHLMDETDLAMAIDGANFCLEVANARGVKAAFVTAPYKELVEAGHLTGTPPAGQLLEVESFPLPVLPLKRIMLPPWLGGPVPGSMVTHARDNFARLTGTK